MKFNDLYPSDLSTLISDMSISLIPKAKLKVISNCMRSEISILRPKPKGIANELILSFLMPSNVVETD